MISSTKQLNELQIKNSILSRGSTSGGSRVRCMINATNQSLYTSGTNDYTARPFVKFRTATVNGYLVPEAYSGWFYTMVSPAAYQENAYVQHIRTTATGAVTIILRRRYVMRNPLAAGKTVGNWRFWTNGITNGSSENGVYYQGSNTGLTGTLTTQVNFGRMDTAGAMTQDSTATETFTLSAATALTKGINVASTTTATTAAQDCIYIEVVTTLTQTARSSGTNAVSINYVTGQGTMITNVINQSTWLDFYIQ